MASSRRPAFLPAGQGIRRAAAPTPKAYSFYNYCETTHARSLTRLKSAESRDDAFAGKGSRMRLRHSPPRARCYASLRYRRSRIAFLRSWLSSLSLPRVAFSELVLASGSVHAGQRLANPGLPGLSSNSSEQILQTFIGNAIGSPKFSRYSKIINVFQWQFQERFVY